MGLEIESFRDLVLILAGILALLFIVLMVTGNLPSMSDVKTALEGISRIG